MPGSAAAGLTHYVDQQLSVRRPTALLIVKYLGVSPPFAGFYQGGLAGAEAPPHAPYTANRLPNSMPHQGIALVTAMSGGSLAGLVRSAGRTFLLLRCAATRSTLSTARPEGFEKLGVPYMPHIPPPAGWGA